MAAEINLLLSDSAARHQCEQASAEVRDLLSWDGRAAELLKVYRRLLPEKFGKVPGP